MAVDEAGDGLDNCSDFIREVSAEVESDRAILEKLRVPRKGENLGHAMALALTTVTILLIFLENDAFFIWLIVALLLYSYNFLIILIPTTTERVRPDERAVVQNIDRERKWLAIKLLTKKRRLALEIGLTVFLGGMVPLASSFTVIFGLALAFAVYLGLLTHALASSVVWSVIIQIGFILLFYAMVLFIEPQSQGFTRIASSLKGRLWIARAQGRSAVMIVMTIMVGIVLAVSVLGLGAMLMPGMTLGTLLTAFSQLTQNDVLILVFIISSQLVLMRHFQGVTSRQMAVNLLNARLDRLGKNVLGPLSSLDLLPVDERAVELERIKREFYSVAIYDIVKHDIFGRSPVYLVGPRLRYVLDDQVLAKLT